MGLAWTMLIVPDENQMKWEPLIVAKTQPRGFKHLRVLVQPAFRNGWSGPSYD